ncbi:MAG TPA: YifB family Mg chelatase-like AAA ATPase [Nocardioidaceae bacterium]|nr:YifB family Mg chelatase-like AAA ATPase [Nocardioidaceae bacterium]
MSLARTNAVTLEGVQGTVIDVEVYMGPGLPRTQLVGLPDPALKESRDRCRAAVINSGHRWPNRNLTIGLSPASVPKGGAIYDLAIALGVLAADGTVPGEPLEDAVLLGELALDGRLRAVPGVLPATLAASRTGITRVMVPEVNAAEAEAVEGVSVVGLRSLRQAIALLTDGELPDDDPPVPPLAYSPRAIWSGQDRVAGLDLEEVLGQGEARWCVEVAAAGGHHLLLEGPPGAGKTMIAERLPGLLPDLDVDESLEVSAVHSIAGTLPADRPLLTRPPFLDPHHSATLVSIIGGGSRILRPGAMSLAHRGVLFMDEAPEFASHVLEGLRQPLESGQISIGRSERTATFPAEFQLVLAANPCPCGFDWGRGDRCECSPASKRRYRHRISGPVRDRIDIYRTVQPVRRHELRRDLAFVESTSTVATRVRAARERQAARYAETPWRRNSEVPGTALRSKWPVRSSRVSEIEAGLAEGRISARGADRILRLSWTLADLAGRAEPSDDDVHNAILLRDSGPLPIARTRPSEVVA